MSPAVRGNKMSNISKTKKQDGQTDADAQVINRDDFERKVEEALVFGKRSFLARTPPSTPPLITVQQEDQPKVVQMDRAEGNRPRDTTEDSPWQDEEMTNPIYRLYVTDDNDVFQTRTALSRRKGKEKHIMWNL